MHFWYAQIFTHVFFTQTTYLVVNNADKSAESYKGRMAHKYGIPIVSMSFVDISLERGELVEPDDYLAVGKTVAEQFQTGKIISTVICLAMLYVIVYVCVCVCVHVHMCLTCVCTFVCTYECINLCIYICLYVCICL